MATRIGSAFVDIEANTSLFRTQATAGIAKALAGVEGKIPVTADTAAARTQIDLLKTRMTALNKQLAEVKIGANGKPAEATIRKLQLQLASLAETVAHITMEADTTKLDAEIARERLQLAKLREAASSLKIDADAKAAFAKIAVLQQQIEVLRAKAGDPEALALDVAAWRAKVQAALAQIELLQAYARKVVIGADNRALLTAIAVSEGAIDRMNRQAADLKLGGTVDLANLSKAELAMLGLEDAASKLNPELKAVNQSLTTGGGAFGRFGLGALTARVALFGGLTAVSGFHIALDVLIESLAVIIPAIVTAGAGLLAFGLAGSDAARSVANQMLNLHTVSDATGATIPPLTGNLERLHAVVRPQVWQLYGDAITIAGVHASLFNKLAVDTGTIIDRLAAKLTVLISGAGPGLTNFLASGARDLQQFARILSNLGDGFAKLIQVSQRTGIAESLLAIVNAGAKLFDLFTKLPLPLLTAIIAFHGIYLWSGLAATGILRLLGPLSKLAATAAGTKLAGSAVQDLAAAGGGGKIQLLGATLTDLGTNLGKIPSRVASAAKAFGALAVANPWIVVGVVAVAAVTALAIAFVHFRDTTGDALKAIDALGAHATIFTKINTTAAQLTQTAVDLAASQKVAAAAAQAAGTAIQGEGKSLQGTSSVFQRGSTDTDRFTAKHKELVAQLQTETTNLSIIAARYGTKGLAGAMALAAVAGVNVNDLFSSNAKTFAIAEQQIAGLVAGYANMGQGSTQLANDINVLTISQSDQLAAVTKLNSAYDNFTGIVAGPTTGFIAFANTLKRFSTDAGVAGAKITGLGSGFTATSRKVTDSSLQLQSDFQDTFKSATQMADAMRLTGTASDAQVAAIKDVVQVMIPMAGTSKIAAAEISSLAQEAGGPATTNLKSLAGWAGKTKDPLGAAQKAADAAGVSFANMSLDAQKLGTTLAQDLSADAAKAVESSVGLQGAMNKFSQDLQNSGTSITQTQKDRQSLSDDLAAIGVTGAQANSIIKSISDRLTSSETPAKKAATAFQNFATGALNLTASDANALWIILGKENLTLTGGKVDITKGKFEKLSTTLGLTKGQADILWAHLRDQYLDTLGRKSDTTKGQFEQLAIKLGETKTQADNLWNSLHKVAAGSPYPTNIKVNAQGLVDVNGYKISAGAFFSPHAAGGFISGGTAGKDSVPGMLMPGEVVVPTNMVKAGAVDHLRGRLPGFARGGMVGDSGNVPQSFGQNVLNGIDSFAVSATQQIAVAATKALAAFAANGLGGNGGAIVNYARSFLGKIPYVFGGNSLSSGIDCSGFTQQVYGHFGIHAPRTSESQFAWANKSAPVPGGLAFYISAAGGPPPGHVAIVQDKNNVISQGGGLGPTLESLDFLPLMGTGVPPGGLPGVGGGTGNKAPFGSGPMTATQIEGVWMAAGGPGGQIANIAQAITVPESGRNPSAVQQGQPYGSTGWGLWQITPGNSEPQAGINNQLLNPQNNAQAAVAKYTQAGFSFRPWTTYDDGAYLPFLLAAGGMIPGYATGGVTTTGPTGGPAATAAYRRMLASQQSHEGVDYLGLRRAFLHGPAKYRNKTIMNEINTLFKEQGAEQVAYKHLSGSGLTATNLGKLAAAARTEARTSLDKALNAAKGGHHGWATGLGYWLGQLAGNATKGLPGGQSTSGPGGAGLPAITHTYGGDIANNIGAFISKVAPFAAGGMVQSYDRGGWLRPGLTMAYNGTGRNEAVGSPGGANITFEVTPSGNAFDAFLISWLKKNVKVKGGGNVQKAWGAH